MATPRVMSSSNIVRNPASNGLPNSTSAPCIPSSASDVSRSSRDGQALTLDDLEILKTIGTGTFARVCLCKVRSGSKSAASKVNGLNNNNSPSKYFALKILSMHDVIRLKQVEHVKNEKNILTEVREEINHQSHNT